MAATLLQHVQGGTGSAGTTLTVKNAATTANSLLVLHIGCRAATQNSISSVGGATWTRAYTTNGLGNDGNVWAGYVLGSASVAANGFLITAAVSGSIEYEFWEWSGMGVTSGTYYANNVATGNSNGPSVASSAPVATGDVAIASIFWPNGNMTIGSLSGTWSTDPSVQGTATGQSSTLQPAWISPSSSATQTFAGTISGAANWVATMTCFSAAAGVNSVTDNAVAGSSITGTVSGGGSGASGNPWLHGAILRGASYASGYQSAYGGMDVNSGADGAITWAALQSTLHGAITGSVGPPNYTGSNQIEKDILTCRAYNTANSVNCTLPWRTTNAWQGVFARIMSGIHSPAYAYCLGASTTGTTNLRGTWATGNTYAVNDAVLFSISVTFPVTGGTQTWTGQAGFICTTAHTSSNANKPPTTPLTGSPPTNMASASNTWWSQVSFFMNDPNFNTPGQVPLFWTAGWGRHGSTSRASWRRSTTPRPR
jgi:hypothetical protein